MAQSEWSCVWCDYIC